LARKHPVTSTAPWWRDAVCYQIYIRSFADSDGDGVGDLAGITSRLPYLRDFGVDALWVTPFFPSPQNDHGYDVSDYRDVDPRFGTLQDFDTMTVEAHRLGLRVIVDLVPNHTSAEHPWFQEALAARPGSRARQRYMFRPGKGSAGERPPNNWQSVFGGPAWAQVEDGEWYLHLFDVSQPDLNWRRTEVKQEFESILRFWLDRGVDGFRVDVAHGLIKDRDLPDRVNRGSFHVAPYWDQPEIHAIYRRWNKILGTYDGDRMAVAEAWADDERKMARYVRQDEFQQAFNFHWLEAPWSAAAFRKVIERTFAAVGPVQASPTWVLSNHDVVREVTRYGGGAQGLARSRAATLTMLALPGSAYIYQGQELGLPEVDVPDKAKQDPAFFRGAGPGRDGSRVPLPWSGTRVPYGFGPDGSTPWLPQPAMWRTLSVEAQDAKPASTLNFFRAALAKRREVVPSLGDEVSFAGSPPGVLAFARTPSTSRKPGVGRKQGEEQKQGVGRKAGEERKSGFVCVLNCSRRPVRLSSIRPLLGDSPDPAHLVIASGQERQLRAGILPPDTAAWFLR
jgi:alpha-glucosidase